MSDALIEAVARAVAVQMTALQGSERGLDDDLTPNERKFYLPIARAALAAIEAAGYRIVPVEPTEDMAKAMLEANIHPPHQSDGSVSVRAQNAHIYAAMLAAAPKVAT